MGMVTGVLSNKIGYANYCREVRIMRGRILIAGTVFAIFLFSASIVLAAANWTIYCHKNGRGSSLGTVTIYFVMSEPKDPKEPARACNNAYSSCGNQCWGCYYWENTKDIVGCYDANGESRIPW